MADTENSNYQDFRQAELFDVVALGASYEDGSQEITQYYIESVEITKALAYRDYFAEEAAGAEIVRAGSRQPLEAGESDIDADYIAEELFQIIAQRDGREAAERWALS